MTEENNECVMPDYKAMYYNSQEETNKKLSMLEERHKEEINKLNKELQFYKDIIKSVLHIERK